MKWNRKVYRHAGDHRTLRRFALLPLPCDAGHWHWLIIMSLKQYVDGWLDWEPCKTIRGRSGQRPAYVCPDKKEQA